tara:strand:+ start:1091 stop:1258 length:168 start_codon:yes stop_codon:yes gene_type:complete
MKKAFKKHMMYKDGKGVMANTYEDHLKLKKKGYGHKKPKSFTEAVEAGLKKKSGY